MPSGAAHQFFFHLTHLQMFPLNFNLDILTTRLWRHLQNPAATFCRWRHSLVVKILPQSCICNTTCIGRNLRCPKPRTTDVDMRKVMTEKQTNSTHLSLCWSGSTSSQFRRKIGKKKTEIFRRLIYPTTVDWYALWQRYLLHHYDVAGDKKINLIIIRFLLRTPIFTRHSCTGRYCCGAY